MIRKDLLAKGKPILFNTEMVQAIQDGQKTQTRRIAKSQSKSGDDRKGSVPPYRAGDILYVRETWTRLECQNCEGDRSGTCTRSPGGDNGCYIYRASHEIFGDAKWHPSIHMPKDAARIFLEVKDVHMEKLQEIGVEDCRAEGIYDDYKCLSEKYHNALVNVAYPLTFANLWNSTVKKKDLEKYGWEANPLVWVIQFERIEED